MEGPSLPSLCSGHAQVSGPDPTETSKSCCCFFIRLKIQLKTFRNSGRHTLIIFHCDGRCRHSYYGYKQLLFRSSPETTAQIHLFSTMPTWWSGALTTCEGMRSRC